MIGLGGVRDAAARARLDSVEGSANYSTATDKQQPRWNSSQSKLIYRNPLFYDVRDYGAVGDGVTNDQAAIQAALDAAKAAGGGTVRLMGLNYLIASGLNCDQSAGVKLEGPGAANLSKPQLTYTAAGSGTIISAKYTQGFGLHGIRIFASNPGFSGYFVDFNLGSAESVSTFCEVSRCWFIGVGANISPGAAAGIHATSAIACVFEGNNFQYMQFGIVGWDGGAGNGPMNVNAIRFNVFYFMTVANIVNVQQSTVIEGNAFEPLLIGITSPVGSTGDLATTATGAQTLPRATVTVGSTTNFPTAGQVNTPQGVITYTGKTATTFTGATGGTGTLAGGAAVWAGPFANAVAAGLKLGPATITDNWWGDQTASGGYAIGGLWAGLDVKSNWFGDATTFLPTDFIRIANFSSGVSIRANRFGGHATVAANAVKYGSSCQGVVIDGNTFEGAALVPVTGSGGKVAGYRFSANGGGAPGSTRTIESGVDAATLTAGTVVVPSTVVTANSVILLTCQVPGGTPGFLRVSARTAGSSFTILSSSGTDASIVGYRIVEPA